MSTATADKGRAAGAAWSWSGSAAIQRCVRAACGREYPVERVMIGCEGCGGLLDVVYDWNRVWPAGRPRTFDVFTQRALTTGPRGSAGETGGMGVGHGAGVGPSESALDFSGVWRFRDLMPFYDRPAQIVTIGEGRTNLQRADLLAQRLGMDVMGGGRVYLQYEGFNPSGSFKDNGMSAGFTHATMVGAGRVACASTGNTSASLAVYAGLTGMRCYVFIGEGKIALGKLSQALDYGAITLQVAGDFDACLARVRYIAEKMPQARVYLMNSVNPFRLEGQKSIMYRVLEGLDWEVPDWIVVPGGNLGNCSAFGKAFIELRELGFITKVPRLAVIQARGARTLDRCVNELGMKWEGRGGAGLQGEFDTQGVAAEYARMDAANERAHTVATAIEINRPVNLSKALRALDAMNGVVRSADDHCIMEHKALVGRLGFGCEPASAASVAGVRKLRAEGVIKPHERVVCILTGHVLKDPDATVRYHMGRGVKGAQAHGHDDDGAASGGAGAGGGGAVGAGMGTGAGMGVGMGVGARAGVEVALGALANRPVRVPDDLGAILRAMEIDAGR